MNALTYGLELAFTGFAVVLVTLFALAMILKLFNRFLAPPQRITAETVSPPPSTLEFDDETAEQKASEGFSLVIDSSGPVQPEVVAAITGAVKSYLEETTEEQQYIAAAIAAVRYAMPAAVPYFESDVIDRRASGTHLSKWAQVGRKRLLHRRQDTALLRRRKVR